MPGTRRLDVSSHSLHRGCSRSAQSTCSSSPTGEAAGASSGTADSRRKSVPYETASPAPTQRAENRRDEMEAHRLGERHDGERKESCETADVGPDRLPGPGLGRGTDSENGAHQSGHHREPQKHVHRDEGRGLTPAGVPLYSSYARKVSGCPSRSPQPGRSSLLAPPCPVVIDQPPRGAQRCHG